MMLVGIGDAGAATPAGANPDIAAVTKSLAGERFAARFDCNAEAPGYRYLVFDRPGLFQPVTYTTGDSLPLRFTADPFGTNEFAIGAKEKLFDPYTSVEIDVKGSHRSFTFYCAKTLDAANQKLM